MLLAAVWAMRQTDLKLMLAYTTVMALSLMIMLIGLGTPEAVPAAMTFLLVHAFYKAGLFLSVGMIEKGAGTRDYPAVAGLARAMPLTDRGRAGGAVDGRPAAALRLRRQGADLRRHHPRAALGDARHRRLLKSCSRAHTLFSALSRMAQVFAAPRPPGPPRRTSRTRPASAAPAPPPSH